MDPKSERSPERSDYVNVSTHGGPHAPRAVAAGPAEYHEYPVIQPGHTL
jgi:hypothetical protein